MAEKTTYVIELNDKLSPGLKKATAKALGLDKAMGGVGKKAKKGSSGVNALGASLKGLVGPLALAAAGMKAFQFASESIQAARKFESLTNAINFASGSIEEGAKNMDFLRSRADLLGTDLLASTEGFKTLSAAMLGSNLQGQGTRDIFDGVQVAATAMGLSSEDAKGTFLALGQIMGKGKVQAEELRGQIGERIPGAFNIAARAMGVTTAELNKMMEQGQLIAEDFLPKFSNELKKTFGKALPTAAESSQAQFNRFNNSMLELKLTLGNKLMPIVNRVMSGFKRFMEFLKLNKAVIMDAFSPLIEHIKETWNLFKGLTEQLGITGSASTFFAKTLGYIKAGLNFLQPILLGVRDLLFSVLGAIIKIAKAFDSLLVKFPAIGKTFMGFVSFFREGLLVIKDLVVSVFGGIGDIIAGALTGNLDQMGEGLFSIGSAFGPENIMKQGKRLGNAFADGFKDEASIKDVTLKGVGAKKDRDFSDVLRQSTGAGAGGANGVAGGAAGPKKSTSLTGVKGGRPTHINIDIGKLIENFNITTTNMQDTTNQLKDKIAQTLLGAVNNVNNIAQ